MSTVYVSKGMKRYAGGTVTETTGKDISGATFQIALGADNVIPPSAWVTPSVNVQGATAADRKLLLLVDNTTPLGAYFSWGRIADNPEIEPVLLDPEPLIVA